MSAEGRRLHLHDRIGSGGFGDVYRATLVSGGGVETLVAIKVLHKDSSPNSQALERLRDEGKMLALIRHPAIVKALDMVVLDGRAAMVTEYVEGADLGLLIRRRALGVRALVEVVGVVAGALNAAYSTMTASGAPLNLVHRDVKPENIRLGRHGDVKLLDFGIAKAGGIRREARTEVGDVVGSYRYMAPERLSRKHADSPEGDVFSLGAVLYEGLCNERLFHGLDLRDQVRLAADGDGFEAFVAARVDALPTTVAVRALLTATLQHDPRQRPAAHKLAARCDELVDVLEGPNLRQWCRTWDWPTEDAAPGPLTGRSIMDAGSGVAPGTPVGARSGITLMVFDDEPTVDAKRTSLVPPAPPPMFQPRSNPPASDPRASSRPAPPAAVAPVQAGRFELWLGAVTSVIVAVLGAIGVGVLVAMVGYTMWRDGAEAPVITVDVEVPAAAEPAPPDPPAGEGAQVGPGVASEEPAVASPGSVQPKAAAAAEAPGPDQETTPGTLVNASRIPVELRGVAGVFGAGAVATGSYVLVADFGDGFEPARSDPVVVGPGATITVKCTVLKRLCEVEVTAATSGG